jgi:hypothetical protein
MKEMTGHDDEEYMCHALHTVLYLALYISTWIIALFWLYSFPQSSHSEEEVF